MPPDPGTRWLIVVRRDRQPLCRLLDGHFAGDPQVRVLRDRRQGERRRTDAPVPADRRRAGRREPLGGRERELWHTFGFRLIVQPEPAR